MITTNVPSVVDEESGLYPPLGLLYVAADIERNSSHEVEILDTHVGRLNHKQIEKEIRRRKPDIVGIQTMTFTLIDVVLTARSVKNVDPSIIVVLGGPHTFIYPEETIRIPEVDYLVLGEGEGVFTKLIDALAKNEDLARVPSIVYQRNGEIYKNEIVPLHQDLDSLAFPARHLIPQQLYTSVLAKRSPITTMMTSRGCPMRCIFCDRPHLGKQFRWRSAENVVEEMQKCEEMGIREIFFYDDTFSIRKDRLLQVCGAIIERGIKVHWDIRAHINTIDEEVLDALQRAGCVRVHYGVESGNQEIIKVIRKGINLEKTKRVFQMTHDRGIATLAYFMLGNPTETREQMEETLEFARNLAADFVHISIATPFPATELYARALRENLYERDYWREFAADMREDFVPRVWDENLSRDELIELLQSGYKSFYMRPSYVLKRLLTVNSWDQFKRQARAGLRLLSWGMGGRNKLESSRKRSQRSSNASSPQPAAHLAAPSGKINSG